MGLPWIKLDSYVPTHRKAVELAALTGDPRAWTYLVSLWLWASQNEPTGLIRGAAARMVVEHAAGWRGTPGALSDAMIAARWIDVADDGLYIHDWHEHQGSHIEYAEREAERKRQAREKTNAAYAGTTSEARPPPGRRTSAAGAQDVVRASAAGAQDFSKTETETETERSTTLSAAADPADLQRLWNKDAHPDLPRWKEMSETRRARAKARLRERPLDGPDSWRVVIASISASPFCRGENSNGWRASPDWILQPDTGAKVLEGKYTKNAPAKLKRYIPLDENDKPLVAP